MGVCPPWQGPGAMRPMTGLEVAVMDVLWAYDRGLMGHEVLEDITRKRHRPHAYTTVMTVLVRLLRRGLVTEKGPSASVLACVYESGTCSYTVGTPSRRERRSGGHTHPVCATTAH